MKRNSESSVRQMRDGQRGQSLVMVALWLVGLISMAAIVVDIGVIYYSYQQLVGATNAAALAGGAAIPAGTAQNTAYEYSGDAAVGGEYNIHPNLNITGVTPTLGCISTTTYPNLGLPPCIAYGSQPAANAIQVTETATVNTFFAKVFGVNSVNISATATASAKGGGAGPYNIMMVLDTTASMGNTTDPGCTVPGIKGAPTPEQCAQYGIQQLLSQLDPCPVTQTSCGAATNGNVANPVDEVGLMVFPGLTPTETSTLTSPPVAAAAAADDYACPTSAPTTVPYNENPAYLILPLQSNYRTSDTAGLNSGSSGADIVKAVGAGVAPCSGVTTPGGQGTFYAGAIAAAQSYLVANTRPNVENVMILLSDGNATASSAQMAGTATSYPATAECQQAVTAAANAKAAGIKIYSVSYGSELTGCTAGDTLTPCQTMEGIASTPTAQYFFSVPQSGESGGTVCAGARSTTSLDQVFTDIAGDLTTSRLVPNSTF